jgi:dienelactone hydrolase
MSTRNVRLEPWFQYLYDHRPRRLSAAETTPANWAAWRAQACDALVAAMGGWPAEQVPLNPEVTEEYDDGDYVRRRLLLDTEPMMSVPCWLLVPKDFKPGERRPAVLALHGHGNGKDDIAGLDHGEEERVNLIKAANYDYARQFARRGYVVIAPDHRNFGERAYPREPLYGRDPCNIVMLKATLFGRNMLLANVWDACKCIDYLQTRDDVDGERLGAAGLSYGGTMTLWTAALDERIKIADVSCYMNSFLAYAFNMDNTCGSQTPANLLGLLDEMWEIAALIAPRALVCENGINDTGFPIAEAQAAHAKIAQAYEKAGVGNRFAADVFEGGHEFSGRVAFGMFAKYLDWHA